MFENKCDISDFLQLNPFINVASFSQAALILEKDSLLKDYGINLL
jgi:hypothetical protein